MDAETDQPQKLSDVRNGPSASLSVRQLEDIVLYLNDTTETLLAFLRTYPVVCDSFVRREFVQRVAGFYELLVPHFRNCLIVIKSENLKEKWKHVKLALIKVCHVILHTCCIEPLERRYVHRNILNINGLFDGLPIIRFNRQICKTSELRVLSAS